MQNDGSERRPLADRDVRDPRLTPDGLVLFWRNDQPGLYSVPAAGGEVSILTRDLARPRVGRREAFSVSPDGTRLLFSEKPGVFVVCTLPACSDRRDLSLSGGSVDWSPDGSGVAYVPGRIAPRSWSSRSMVA